MKTGKPVWRVIAEAVSTDKKKGLRTYHVIAPEMEQTPRGQRSNEWNVKEVCQEKGYNIISAIFLGFTSPAPAGSIDISQIPAKDEEEKTPKKKPFNKHKKR